MAELSAAALAFDHVADSFDARFGGWLSVSAQRRAVRTALAAAFPAGSSLLEIGGGAGEDALWLAERGRRVLLTDVSPAMVQAAAARLAGCAGADTRVAAAEALGALADERAGEGFPLFDGAFSNFAALNCVTDLAAFAGGVKQLLRPGAPLMLVVFGTACPGEMLVEAVRGRPRNMLRRRIRGDVEARLGGQAFTVRYHRSADLHRALFPWFELQGRQGVGVFVPPSAAEPWISRHPRLLGVLEGMDRLLSQPLAALGDHVLYRFIRTDAAPG